MLGLIAFLRNYYQTLFYPLSVLYLMASIPFILMESVGKWQLLKIILKTEDVNICNTIKMSKINEAVSTILSILLFFSFLVTFIFYCTRDEYMVLLLDDLMFNI